MNQNQKKNLSTNEPVKKSIKKNNSKDDLNRRNKVAFEPSNNPSLNIDRDFLDRYTPNTDFDDYPQELFHDYSIGPDLTLICKECNNHISIEELNYHDKFHDLLIFFGFKETPESEAKLNEKRLMMIKNLPRPTKGSFELDKNKINEWNSKIMIINEKYETLKSFINSSFESNRILNNNFKQETQGESIIVSNEKILAVGICSLQNPHKKFMEDSNIIMDNFGENPDLTYIGTFDGYDGDVSSNRCCEQLHLGILNAMESIDKSRIQFIKDKYNYDEINNLEKFDYLIKDDDSVSSKIFSDYYQTSKTFSLNNFSTEELNYESSFNEEEKILAKLYRHSFKYAYQEMDKLLAKGKGETSRIRWSGCTLCSCIIEKKENTGWIHMANCGDVEAILVINNPKSTKKSSRNHKVLTTIHTINECPKDKVSLEKRGCKLLEVSNGQKKIQGLYSITRGLGFHGDNKVKRFISSKPSIRSYKIEDNHVALIIGTKGLWNAIGHEKVADIVLQLMPSRKVPFINERPTSPSVKTMLHQYYINKNKEKSREKSILQTVQDNNEVDYINPVENENEKYKSDESINSKFDKNDHLSDNNNNQNVNLESSSNEMLKQSAKLEFENIDFDPDLDFIQNDASEKENLDIKSNTSNKREEDFFGVKIKETDFKAVQVSEYELRKFERKMMDDRNVAKRLDVSQSIAETLASCALKAGSSENITVNCILLPGCNL